MDLSAAGTADDVLPQGAGGATLVYDPETLRIVDASPAACALYGYERAELLELGLEDLRPPEDVPRFRELARTVGDREVRRRRAVRHRRRDGEIIEIDLESHPLTIDERPLRMVFLEESPAASDLRQVVQAESDLFRTTTEAVVVFDAAGTIRDWNPAAERLWGYDRDDAVGNDWSLIHPTGDADDIAMREVLESGELWEGTVHTVGRTGHRAVCEARLFPTLGGAEDRLLAVIGLFRDVTRQRATERALAHSTEDFRLLGDQIPHIVWMADPTGRTYYMNERWERVSGQSREEAVGEGWARAIHPEDAETTNERWEASVAEARELSVEHRIRTKDGRYRWFLTRASPVVDSAGTVVRWIGSSVDIHVQKTAEDAIRRRESYFRGVFENAHDAIIVFDREAGRVMDVNPAAERLYGYDRAAFLRLSLTDLFADAAGAYRLLGALNDPERTTRQLEQVDRAGEALVVEVNAAPMDYEGRPVLLTVNRDLTERSTLERQLQQAQKMEALGRLAGGVAHDFNNLTTAIKGFASLLSDELGSDSRAADALREIDRAANRAADLSRQLLAYTRQSVMRPQVLDLNDTIRSSHRLLTRLIGADIDFRLDLAEEIWAVRADPSQLHQVLMNLAVNARDAMPDGGTLRIETRCLVVDRVFAEDRPPIEPGAYVRIRVSDTGVGMSEETRIRAFEPFYTTKGVGEGTGLGLATAYGIVKQSSGYIWIDSAPGEGATIDVYLPRVDEPLPAPTTVEDLTAASGEGPARGTIVVVEDEAAVRKLARRVLERAGFEVADAPDGEAALALMDERGGRVDLVLADMVMPRMGGKELAERLALTRPDTPILFMSGYTGETLAERGDLTRKDVVLEKPFEPAQLVKAVRSMMEEAGTG